MKIIFMASALLFTSLSFAESTESTKQLECFKKLQTAYENTEKKGIKKKGMAMPSRAPSDFILGSTGEVAWTDGKGKLRVSSEKGSLVVTGRSCSFEYELTSREALQLAYDYMSQYDAKDWQEEKSFCNSAGVSSIMDQLRNKKDNSSPNDGVK